MVQEQILLLGKPTPKKPSSGQQNQELRLTRAKQRANIQLLKLQDKLDFGLKAQKTPFDSGAIANLNTHLGLGLSGLCWKSYCMVT